MILLGAFSANRVWAYWAVSGVVLGAAYLLWLYQRVFWGKITHEENERLVDLNAREIATLVPLVALCFWIGLAPGSARNRDAVSDLAERVNPQVTGPDRV